MTCIADRASDDDVEDDGEPSIHTLLFCFNAFNVCIAYNLK